LALFMKNDWQSTVLSQGFYDREPITVAKELLGKFLVRKMGNSFLVGKITETEAYLSSGDSAAHNFKGQTKRNASLYKSGGHAYVHSMRQYCLLDAVTEDSGKPGSVLIRSIEPIEGLAGLINGPGKVCRELNITRTLDGIDMTNPDNELFISQGKDGGTYDITASSRVGISTAKDMPLRFQIPMKNSKKSSGISSKHLTELERNTLITSTGASTRLAGSKLSDKEVEQVANIVFVQK